ncbi:hypothetical protein [Planctobacterium marinum]|uniref:hypothetical protein n=1 Tax=Planctobacterium marinum TaxID=1631968 RepID=UPI001E319E75|nr:hypothetical protein [Planctobacterium marinum]MCC2606395.1 hypothetical protein [Planctobacterium marinum]
MLAFYGDDFGGQDNNDRQASQQHGDDVANIKHTQFKKGLNALVEHTPASNRNNGFESWLQFI